ncbi:endonuclease domain-containing protein [Rubrivirga sp.]|uniref:endonuclease domain-containing protein n=1 Tax=Rubrivirga sp. TaxID=1885344 RepID=UPI003C793BB9
MGQHHNRPDLLDRRRALRNGATKAEAVLWSALKGRRLDGLKFRRQHSVGRFVLDFYCPSRRLGLEVDGGVHDDPARAAYDGDRQRWLEARGIRVVRATNAEVLETLDVVVERVRDAVRAEG